MGMYENGQRHRLLERGDQIEAFLRAHNAGHILDAQRLTAHALDFLGQAHIHLQVMDGRNRVTNRALRVSARFQAGLHRSLNIAQVVKRIKNTHDVHAVLNRCTHKPTHSII